jgi:hypothetical protein
MDTELFEQLVYKLHGAEALMTPGHPTGPAKFCRDCRTRVEYLVPVIEDLMQERRWET